MMSWMLTSANAAYSVSRILSSELMDCMDRCEDAWCRADEDADGGMSRADNRLEDCGGRSEGRGTGSGDDE
jgi:SH3-like domain-containing protein